jgi:hypothetical protein
MTPPKNPISLKLSNATAAIDTTSINSNSINNGPISATSLSTPKTTMSHRIPHRFSAVSLLRPMQCHACRRWMWNWKKQGLRCRGKIFLKYNLWQPFAGPERSFAVSKDPCST